MDKIKIFSLITIVTLLLGTTCYATNKNGLKIIEKQDVINIEEVEDYRNSILDEIIENDVQYKLESIKETENKATLSKDKKICKEIVVTTNNKSEILKMFENKKDIQEDGYSGKLKLQTNSLTVKINNSYQKEYKVYLQKTYKNIKSNELNDVPKEIKKDGVTYYLVNPVWKIGKTEKIGNNEIPLTYNGTMYYEGKKAKEIVKDYKATVEYEGTLEKEVVSSITINMKYKEVPKEANYIVPITTTTGAIIVFSGIVILKRKNAKIYNYDNVKGKYNYIKKIHIDKKESIITITTLKKKSNKYKIVLANRIFKELQDKNIVIKYFDKQIFYKVKEKEFEIYI